MQRLFLDPPQSVYLDGHKAVQYRSKLNPSLGRNFEAMDPLEWLARMADHIPDTGKPRTHFYDLREPRPGRAGARQRRRASRPSQPPPKDAVRRAGRGSSARCTTPTRSSAASAGGS